MKILLIEDRPVDADLVRKAIGNNGITELNVRDSIYDLPHALRDFQPDIVVLDYSVQGTDSDISWKTLLSKKIKTVVAVLTR